MRVITANSSSYSARVRINHVLMAMKCGCDSASFPGHHHFAKPCFVEWRRECIHAVALNAVTVHL